MIDPVAPMNSVPALTVTTVFGAAGLVFSIASLVIFHRYRHMDDIKTRDWFLTTFQSGMVIFCSLFACVESVSVYSWGFLLGYLVSAFTVSNFSVAFAARCLRCAALCRSQKANSALANRNISNASFPDISIPPASPTRSPTEMDKDDSVPSDLSKMAPNCSVQPQRRIKTFLDRLENALPWDLFVSNKMHRVVITFALGSFLYFAMLLIWAGVTGPSNVMPHGWARLFVIQLPALLVLTPLSLIVTPIVLYALKDFDDMYGIRRDCFFNLYIANVMVGFVLVIVIFTYNDPEWFLDYRGSTQLDFVLFFYYFGSFTSIVLPTYNAYQYEKTRSRTRELRATISSRPKIAGKTRVGAKDIILEHTQSSLQQVLGNPTLMRDLIDFSARAFASENLLFYTRYWKLRKTWGVGLHPAINKPRRTATLDEENDISPEQQANERAERLEQLQIFVNDFIGDLARYQVNITSEASEKVTTAMRGAPEDISFLEDAYHQVMKNAQNALTINEKRE